MTKKEVQERVLQNGKPLALSKFMWDEKTNTFSTKENGLVLDFNGISYYTFKTGGYCTFSTGDNCTFSTGGYCTFSTGDNCTFSTGHNCTFSTGDNCTFSTGDNCTFSTRGYCTFSTRGYCTFSTGDNCTFSTGHNCTFTTSYNCVVVRRDTFEVIKLAEKIKTVLCPWNIKGYLEEINEKMYLNGIIENGEYIIVDNILSKVINRKKNIIKVINYGDKDYSFIVRDGEYNSHGKTIKQAYESLIFKRKSKDLAKFESWKLNDVKTKSELIEAYRSITGACEYGTKMFCESNNLPESCSVKECINLTTGQYRNDIFSKFFRKGE